MKNILKLIFIVPLLFVVQLVLMLLGFVVVPLALLFRSVETKNDCTNTTSNPNHKFADDWVDGIWGNDDDGIDGDIYYLKNHTHGKINFMTRFNWVLLRNPVHNFSLNGIGFKGYCKSLKEYMKNFGNETIEINCKRFCNYKNALSERGYEYLVANDKYPMIRVRFKYPFINYGWKNWNCDKYKEYHRYTMTVLINPFHKIK